MGQHRDFSATVPLVSYRSALPILMSWADSVGDTLDVCPLPRSEHWVYFAGAPNKCIKVGVTQYPNHRPYNCWRGYYGIPPTWPMLLISDSGPWVERLVKRAGAPFRFLQMKHVPGTGPREVFEYESPVLALVRELQAASIGVFDPLSTEAA